MAISGNVLSRVFIRFFLLRGRAIVRAKGKKIEKYIINNIVA